METISVSIGESLIAPLSPYLVETRKTNFYLLVKLFFWPLIATISAALSAIAAMKLNIICNIISERVSKREREREREREKENIIILKPIVVIVYVDVHAIVNDNSTTSQL